MAAGSGALPVLLPPSLGEGDPGEKQSSLAGGLAVAAGEKKGMLQEV